MPEIGRPASMQQNQLMQVEMRKDAKKIDQELIEQAGGRRADVLKPAKDPKNMDQSDRRLIKPIDVIETDTIPVVKLFAHRDMAANKIMTMHKMANKLRDSVIVR